MSESWQPGESEIWQTRPSESSHPSFPFADREVDPFWQPFAASQPIPPPPPPPHVTDATRQDDRTTEPIIGTTFGMGIGVIVGAVVTFGLLMALLGYLLLNGGLGLGNHAHFSETNTSSLSVGGSTQGGSGGGNGSKGGGGGNQGGAGAGGAGVTGTNGATAAPGTTPINTGTPGASMTATTIAATGTATPSLPTLTPSPGALPLTVTATAQSHKSITISVQTMAGATLTIAVTFCDGTHGPTIIGAAGNGTYSNTITNGIPKCPGNPPDTVIVTGHLADYNDTTVTTTTTQGG